MTYATKDDVLERFNGIVDDALCESLLEESALLIDAYNKNADYDAKRIVSVRMVVRMLGSGADNGMPMGTSQGTISALGYSQTFTLGSGGSTGELYISRMEKKMLGYGNKIGCSNPLEVMGCVE